MAVSRGSWPVALEPRTRTGLWTAAAVPILIDRRRRTHRLPPGPPDAPPSGARAPRNSPELTRDSGLEPGRLFRGRLGASSPSSSGSRRGGGGGGASAGPGCGRDTLGPVRAPGFFPDGAPTGPTGPSKWSPRSSGRPPRPPPGPRTPSPTGPRQRIVQICHKGPDRAGAREKKRLYSALFFAANPGPERLCGRFGHTPAPSRHRSPTRPTQAPPE